MKRRRGVIGRRRPPTASMRRSLETTSPASRRRRRGRCAAWRHPGEAARPPPTDLERTEDAEVERAARGERTTRVSPLTATRALSARERPPPDFAPCTRNGRRSDEASLGSRSLQRSPQLCQLAGCGGGTDEDAAAGSATASTTYELTEEYLVENGISAEQARERIRRARGDPPRRRRFIDRWRTATVRTGSCWGTYSEGTGSASLSVSSGLRRRLGDEVRGRGRRRDLVEHRGAPADDPEEDQKITEVFNSVPWTRVGDAS